MSKTKAMKYWALFKVHFKLWASWIIGALVGEWVPLGSPKNMEKFVLLYDNEERKKLRKFSRSVRHITNYDLLTLIFIWKRRPMSGVVLTHFQVPSGNFKVLWVQHAKWNNIRLKHHPSGEWTYFPQTENPVSGTPTLLKRTWFHKIHFPRDSSEPPKKFCRLVAAIICKIPQNSSVCAYEWKRGFQESTFYGKIHNARKDEEITQLTVGQYISSDHSVSQCQATRFGVYSMNIISMLWKCAVHLSNGNETAEAFP